MKRVKDLRYALFLDRYGCLLTEGRRRMMEQYYYDDLSISEIAQEEGITRQAAHEALHSAEKTLEMFEEKLGIVEKESQLRAMLGQLDELIRQNRSGQAQWTAAEDVLQNLRGLLG